jgi:hypothetical protein
MQDRFLTLLFTLLISLPAMTNGSTRGDGHAQLVALYKTWRAFETPPMKNGAPDYTQATFTARMPAFQKIHQQLLSMDRVRRSNGLVQAPRLPDFTPL